MKLSITEFFKSSLVGGHRRWHMLLGAIFALLLANTLFLLARRYWFGCALEAFDACRASIFYQASVLLHSALGIALVLAAIIFGSLHIPHNWKIAQRRIQLLITGLFIFITLGLLLWSGLYFIVHAKSNSVTWLYNIHIVVAVIIVLLYFVHRIFARPERGSGVMFGGITVILLITMLFVGIEVEFTPSSKAIEPKIVTAPHDDMAAYRPQTWVAPEQPFFPSSVSLVSGAARVNSEQLLGTSPAQADQVRLEVANRGFASSVLIGAEQCVRCHADTVEQWSTSAHRFSSFNNPFYVATLEYLRQTPVNPNEFIQAHLTTYGLEANMTGRVKSRWCAGCHDPLLILPGQMLEKIDKGSVAAQAGLTCLSCHLIKNLPNHTGNANYVWNDEFQDSYIFSKATSGLGMLLHDTYLKANPERHVVDMIQPFYRTPEYCATCHKVSLNRAVNDYRWLRGQDEYDAWQNSGVSHNAARTFYLPPLVRRCQDCHMPLVETQLGDLAAKHGMVRSHRFVAANSALPWLRGDTQMIDRIEQFLRGNALRLFIGGVSFEADKNVVLTDGAPHSLPGTLDHIDLHVIVRNLNVGHTFPAGTNDSNEAWIEITTPSNGDKVYSAGSLRSDGQVNGNTRIYNMVAVDRNGKRIDKRNAHEMVAPIYVAVIPPGTADLSRYAIPIAKLGDLTSGTNVKVRLLWRKFNRVYTEFAYATNKPGFMQFKIPPELPITEIATANLFIKKVGENLIIQAQSQNPATSADLMHDYAIGLLLQGDFKLAKQMITSLLAIDPECVNCLRTRARIELGEGQFDDARQTITKAEKLAPADPQNAWLWAQILLQEGNYTAAGQAVDRALAVFPGDRMAYKLKARVAYLDGHFENSLKAVNAALAIDPEDSTAYYYAMLAYRALGNTQQEKVAESAYRYHKLDETAQQATLTFRQTEGEANFAAQNIKVFELQ